LFSLFQVKFEIEDKETNHFFFLVSCFLKKHFLTFLPIYCLKSE
jgi:hypothetical protein